MSGPNSTAVAAAIDVDNSLFAHYLLIALVGILVSVGVYRLVIGSLLYIRTLTCLNNDEQRFFKIPTKPFAWIKRHVLYAPLFNRRHSKQMRIGPVEMGILPTRFQSLLLVGIITTNIFLCAYGIEWHGPIITLLKHLGHRTGTFAVVNMIPLVIMAARNNPLIGFLRISYDTFNLMHRWFGRLVVSLTITHSVVCIIVIVINKKKMHIPGWEAFTSTLKEVRFIAFGFIVSDDCRPLSMCQARTY